MAIQPISQPVAQQESCLFHEPLDIITSDQPQVDVMRDLEKLLAHIYQSELISEEVLRDTIAVSKAVSLRS